MPITEYTHGFDYGTCDVCGERVWVGLEAYEYPTATRINHLGKEIVLCTYTYSEEPSCAEKLLAELWASCPKTFDRKLTRLRKDAS